MTETRHFQMSRSMMGDQAADYAKALTECHTLADLRALVDAYKPLALDAVPVVDAMTDDDFAAWRKGLKTERRGKFAGETFAEKYGAVLMPMPMLKIVEIADRYKVPFGVAWQRAKDLRPELLEVTAASRP